MERGGQVVGLGVSTGSLDDLILDCMFLSVYENKIEKRVDKVLSKVKLGKSNSRYRERLVDLFFEFPFETAIWLEYKYKGYRFLKKSKRRKMYEVAELIEEDFLEWMEKHPYDAEKVEMTVPERLVNEKEEQDVWKLMMIGEFSKGRYKYRESSAFWKLFPARYGEEGMKMIGDCNQIVTFYVGMFAIVGDVEDLEIRVLPNHVCLHIHGLDYEATNGTFKDYKDKGYLVDCENILAINLLDITDPSEKKWDVSEVNTAKMQAVAAMFEVEAEIVEKNLIVTYKNMGIFYMNSRKWDQARKHFRLAQAEDLERMAYHNEVVWLLGLKKYKKAIRVAHKGGLEEIEEQVRREYIVDLAKKRNWKKGMAEARKLGDKELIKYVYGKEFEYLYAKVDDVDTVKGARKYKSTYKRLLFLAKKLGDKKAEESVRSIMRKI